MAGLLPLKIGTLLIKQLTKPLANSLKVQAAQPGVFRSSCRKYGQFHHQVESHLSLRLLGHTVKSVKPLDEEAAVQLGASVFSEFFLFTTACGLLILEMTRKNKSDEEAKKVKDLKDKEEKMALERKILGLEKEIDKIHREMEKLHWKQSKIQEKNKEILPSSLASINENSSSTGKEKTAEKGRFHIKWGF